MRARGALVLAVLLIAGCKGGDGGTTADSSTEAIGADEINRYQLELTGDLAMAHTGGLVCAVADGAMTMDFSIDASDGVYEYEATIPAFDPAASSFDASFDLTASGAPTASGTVQVTFGYGPAPEEYPGVVRAAGAISGSLTTNGGQSAVSGTYACFLQDAAVGH